MKQNDSDAQKQVKYLDRWVDSEFFRAFVYKDGSKKLAESYDEFKNLISSGIWFDDVKNIPKADTRLRKPKNGDAKSEC
jgi:hypothetical protein